MQANKFVGVNNPVAKKVLDNIKSAKSPEEAARLGRKIQRQHPDLVLLSDSNQIYIGMKTLAV